MSQPQVGDRRREIQRLDDPTATILWAGRGHLLACEVEVQRPQHIHSVTPDEQPERATDARVDVEQLVLVVALIEAVANVEDPPVSEGLHEPPGRLMDVRL